MRCGFGPRGNVIPGFEERLGRAFAKFDQQVGASANKAAFYRADRTLKNLCRFIITHARYAYQNQNLTVLLWESMDGEFDLSSWYNPLLTRPTGKPTANALQQPAPFAVSSEARAEGVPHDREKP